MNITKTKRGVKMKPEKIEGYKIRYRVSADGTRYTKKCPFGKDIKVGSWTCNKCNRYIAWSYSYKFIICKGDIKNDKETKNHNQCGVCDC